MFSDTNCLVMSAGSEILLFTRMRHFFLLLNAKPWQMHSVLPELRYERFDRFARWCTHSILMSDDDETDVCHPHQVAAFMHTNMLRCQTAYVVAPATYSILHCVASFCFGFIQVIFDWSERATWVMATKISGTTILPFVSTTRKVYLKLCQLIIAHLVID